MPSFFELEEQVGRAWHRLVSQPGSYRRFPDAAVELGSLRTPLAVFFRALGGDPAVAVVEASLRGSAHRLTWRQRLAMPDERVVVAKYDVEALRLPDSLDLLPQPALNRDLYFWLAAFLAEASHKWDAIPDHPLKADPLRADLTFIRNASRASERVRRRYRGLCNSHHRLCRTILTLRPRRTLPPQEAAVEALTVALLGGPPPADGVARAMMEAVSGNGSAIVAFAARRGYRPMLPVPLWGEVGAATPGLGRGADDSDSPEGGSEHDQDARRFAAQRDRHDQSERDDPLILNRFEKILAWAEMVNVNRATDDEDEDAARRAAEDLDQIDLAHKQRKVATRLKLDLDLKPAAAEAVPLAAEVSYPEWDFRRAVYLPDHCRVVQSVATTEGGDWRPDEAARRRIRHVRRQFEALRPRRVLERRRLDGSELDTDAAVRARCDLIATGIGSELIFQTPRNAARDLSVSILTDVSLSTDGWVENRRILDVEKEALSVLAHGLAGCADDFQIMTFSSRRRDNVRMEMVKSFDETSSAAVFRRIAALRPGAYTRMGAAIRHATRDLHDRASRYRLLLLLTDGKPNDTDHYEGRYGLEDTRIAVREARRSGVAVFAITIDKKARDYVPYLFGRGGYAIVGQVGRLPAALPALYRHLTS